VFGNMARCSHGETRRNIKDKEKKNRLVYEKTNDSFKYYCIKKITIAWLKMTLRKRVRKI
jgi:hypothetical protein